MARPKKVSPSPAVKTTTVLDRIRAAEKSLLTGATARVLISETDLENVASLIMDTGSTQAQLLKKAVHLGLQVLRIGGPESKKPEAPALAQEEPFETEWARPTSLPYSGFIPMESASHYLKDTQIQSEDLTSSRNLEDLETQF